MGAAHRPKPGRVARGRSRAESFGNTGETHCTCPWYCYLHPPLLTLNELEGDTDDQDLAQFGP